MQRIKAFGYRNRAVFDMTEAEIEQMTLGRVAPEYDQLNALLADD